MSYISKASLIGLPLLFIPLVASAKQFKIHGEVVITLRNGSPCFSYPQDSEIRKKPYSFSYLNVSTAGPMCEGGWAADIVNLRRQGLVEPNKPDTCIQYGVLNPGMKEKRILEPLQLNTPYEVFMSVSTSRVSKAGHDYYERRYASKFCLGRDVKGETVLVGVGWDDNAYAPHCLKPGESTKRSFWRRLFGK